MTVIVTAVFTPGPDGKQPLIEALTATMPAVHEEQGCRLYAIHDADDGTITMIEKWTTAEDLTAHGAGPAVAALSERVSPLLAHPAVVTTMVPLPVGDGRGLLQG